MPHHLLHFSMPVLLTFCLLPLVWAHDFHIGQTLILQAQKSIGVPLHRNPDPSYLKHVPTDTSVTLEKITKKGKWLFIRLSDGTTAWVHSKYIKASSPSPGPSPTPNVATTSMGGEKAVWSSRDQCKKVIKQGSRMGSSSSSILRLASWNIRWFPIGQPPDQQGDIGEATDLSWLTCTIIWMQPDILSIQESLATPEATKAWKTLITSLNEKTGATWKWYRQPCGRPGDHHIGILWNDTRVSLSQFESLWQFNAKAESAHNPCTFGLRPGQYAHVKSRQDNGVDFHLIAVHLKSGPTVFAVEARQKALNRIDQTVKPLLDSDRDVVILGDFNTMGAGDRQSQKSELKYIRRMVAKEKPGFQDLSLTPQCSHYFRGHGGWLDHVLVAKEMKEVTVTSARVTGYCALAGCQRIKGDYPLAYRRLSDHCPVVVDIENRDED